MTKKKVLFIGGPLNGRGVLIPFCKSVLPGTADYPGPGVVVIGKAEYQVVMITTTEGGKSDVVFFFKEKRLKHPDAVREIFKLAMKGGGQCGKKRT